MRPPPGVRLRCSDLDGPPPEALPSNSLTEVAGGLRILLSIEKAARLDRYAALLLEANPRAGLVSGRTDRATLYRRHIDEALALAAALDAHGVLASPVIDIGTGGGLPGLPLKIARPELEITLVEANRKKAQFLREAVADLGLAGITVICGRAEELARDAAHRETYALALARAVAPLRTLLELTLPFLQMGGMLAAPKGSSAAREIEAAEHALRTLGGEVVRCEPLSVPNARKPTPTLVIVKKVARTPDSYPRRAGMAKKRPL